MFLFFLIKRYLGVLYFAKIIMEYMVLLAYTGEWHMLGNTDILKIKVPKSIRQFFLASILSKKQLKNVLISTPASKMCHTKVLFIFRCSKNWQKMKSTLEKILLNWKGCKNITTCKRIL